MAMAMVAVKVADGGGGDGDGDDSGSDVDGGGATVMGMVAERRRSVFCGGSGSGPLATRSAMPSGLAV